MEDKKEITVKDILQQGKRKNPTIQKELILRAYEYAKEKHKDQKRKSGEPYIIHPVYVAYILASLGLDTKTICAALLHDVVEDTEATYEEIQEKFGQEIAMLVEGVTKLSDQFRSLEEKQTENYKKMFIAMEKDIRVIILKLADRLHNITTLEHLKRDRQIAISKETIELYAPIAHKLGMYDLKMRLQDGAFRYLYPEKYEEIMKKLKQQIKEKENSLQETKTRIEYELRRQRIPSILKIETKHLYNIYKKMKEKKIDIHQIKDLFAIKIIVKEKSECYRVLGILNMIYPVLPKSFKDYIATPRNNRYQAIHEILLGENGAMFEAQICSYSMNQIAKYGITNYFPYMNQTRIQKEEANFQKNLEGIHDSIELENIIENPKEFLNTLKSELLDDEIYIFTPKGEIKVLPKNAIAIDFAYSIHNDIGNHMEGCKINSISMPLETKLKNGDIVEIITRKEEVKGKQEWLEKVKTAKAKSAIVKLLKKQGETQKERVKIEILGQDRKNLVLEISNIFTKHHINIEALQTQVTNELARIEIEIEITQENHLKKILPEISNINSIKQISLKKNKENEKT